jgi:hypothetical protein
VVGEYEEALSVAEQTLTDLRNDNAAVAEERDEHVRSLEAVQADLRALQAAAAELEAAAGADAEERAHAEAALQAAEERAALLSSELETLRAAKESASSRLTEQVETQTREVERFELLLSEQQDKTEELRAQLASAEWRCSLATQRHEAAAGSNAALRKKLQLLIVDRNKAISLLELYGLLHSQAGAAEGAVDVSFHTMDLSQHRDADYLVWDGKEFSPRTPEPSAPAAGVASPPGKRNSPTTPLPPLPGSPDYPQLSSPGSNASRRLLKPSSAARGARTPASAVKDPHQALAHRYHEMFMQMDLTATVNRLHSSSESSAASPAKPQAFALNDVDLVLHTANTNAAPASERRPRRVSVSASASSREPELVRAVTPPVFRDRELREVSFIEDAGLSAAHDHMDTSMFSDSDALIIVSRAPSRTRAVGPASASAPASEAGSEAEVVEDPANDTDMHVSYSPPRANSDAPASLSRDDLIELSAVRAAHANVREELRQLEARFRVEHAALARALADADAQRQGKADAAAALAATQDELERLRRGYAELQAALEAAEQELQAYREQVSTGVLVPAAAADSSAHRARAEAAEAQLRDLEAMVAQERSEHLANLAQAEARAAATEEQRQRLQAELELSLEEYVLLQAQSQELMQQMAALEQARTRTATDNASRQQQSSASASSTPEFRTPLTRLPAPRGVPATATATAPPRATPTRASPFRAHAFAPASPADVSVDRSLSRHPPVSAASLLPASPAPVLTPARPRRTPVAAAAAAAAAAAVAAASTPSSSPAPRPADRSASSSAAGLPQRVLFAQRQEQSQEQSQDARSAHPEDHTHDSPARAEAAAFEAYALSRGPYGSYHSDQPGPDASPEYDSEAEALSVDRVVGDVSTQSERSQLSFMFSQEHSTNTQHNSTQHADYRTDAPSFLFSVDSSANAASTSAREQPRPARPE